VEEKYSIKSISFVVKSLSPSSLISGIIFSSTKSRYNAFEVEASANRYTFVWKKSIQNHESKLNENSKALYRDLVEEKIIPVRSISIRDFEYFSSTQMYIYWH
jgi:hypothetical protein